MSADKLNQHSTFRADADNNIVSREVNKCFAMDTSADIQTENHANAEVVSRTYILKSSNILQHKTS